MLKLSKNFNGKWVQLPSKIGRQYCEGNSQKFPGLFICDGYCTHFPLEFFDNYSLLECFYMVLINKKTNFEKLTLCIGQETNAIPNDR